MRIDGTFLDMVHNQGDILTSDTRKSPSSKEKERYSPLKRGLGGFSAAFRMLL